MTPKEFAKYEKRDKYCPHCGKMAPYLVPHHRANRGAGGSKLANRPSNILAVCAVLNSEMESNPAMAEIARQYGWKISKWNNPLIIPIYDAVTREWFRLGDDFSRTKVSQSPHQT